MKITNVDLQIIGIKHTAPFAEYAAVIPEKVEQMSKRENELTDVTNRNVIVYEPKKDDQHEVGFFYTGVIVSKENGEIPNGMEAMHLTGEYAVLDTVFDGSRMGEYYGTLDRWIVENGYQHQGEYIMEVYEQKETELALSIYLPVIAKVLK